MKDEKAAFAQKTKQNKTKIAGSKYTTP